MSRDSTSWQVSGGTLIDPGSQGSSSGEAIADLAVDLAGPAGFARVTVVTEQTVANSPAAGPILNDVLFEVGGPTRLVARLKPDTRQVEFTVRTPKAESTATVGVEIPDLTSRRIMTTLLTESGAVLAAHREISLGKWSFLENGATWTLTVRILLNLEPVGPRLKPDRTDPR